MSFKAKKVAAILCSDFHLRFDAPRCRIDDYVAAQTSKLAFISKLQKKYNCPVIHSGDLFTRWKNEQQLFTYAFKNLPKQFITIPGNHDLPNHSNDYYEQSSMAVIDASGNIKVASEVSVGNRVIFLIHEFVWYKQKPEWVKSDEGSALTILKKYRQFPIILAGDNHETFVCRTKTGRLLVNPGSLMRMTAEQIHHRPSCFLYDADENDVEQVFIPIQKDVVVREHIEQAQQREAYIDSFLGQLEAPDTSTEFHYRKAILQYIKTNKVNEQIKSLVMEAVDGTGR